MPRRCARTVATLIAAALLGACASAGLHYDGQAVDARGAVATTTPASTGTTRLPKGPDHALARRDPLTYARASVDATYARTAHLFAQIDTQSSPEFTASFDGVASLDGQRAIGTWDMSDLWHGAIAAKASLKVSARTSGVATYFDMPTLAHALGAEAPAIPARLRTRRWLALGVPTLLGPSGLGATTDSLLFLLAVVHAKNSSSVNVKQSDQELGATEYSFMVRSDDARTALAQQPAGVPAVFRNMLLTVLPDESMRIFITLVIDDHDGLVHGATLQSGDGSLGGYPQFEVQLSLSHFGTPVTVAKPADADVTIDGTMMDLTHKAVGGQ